MHIIDSVFVRGFWGSHEVAVNAHTDFNFIIGANGSGKSTFLKLVAGVLLAEKDYLSVLDFDYVKIVLKAPGSRKRPYIEVTKENGNPFFWCIYKCYESASDGKAKTFNLSEIDGAEHQIRFPGFLRNSVTSRLDAKKNLVAYLSGMISVSWLSVHRITKLDGVERIDPLDIKLEDLSNRLVRYLSLLSKQVNQLYEKFQEQIFLSLLVDEGGEQII